MLLTSTEDSCLPEAFPVLSTELFTPGSNVDSHFAFTIWQYHHLSFLYLINCCHEDSCCWNFDVNFSHVGRLRGWMSGRLRDKAQLTDKATEPAMLWAAEIAVAFFLFPQAVSVRPFSQLNVPSSSRCSALPFSIIHPQICREESRFV